LRNSAALNAVLDIAGWMHSGIVTITLKDLIELEHTYPGLLKDVDLCLWQVHLIKSQLEGEGDDG
jgi:hypothetical protein